MHSRLIIQISYTGCNYHDNKGRRFLHTLTHIMQWNKNYSIHKMYRCKVKACFFNFRHGLTITREIDISLTTELPYTTGALKSQAFISITVSSWKVTSHQTIMLLCWIRNGLDAPLHATFMDTTLKRKTFIYWESEPMTYTITMLGLSMYRNIEE